MQSKSQFRRVTNRADHKCATEAESVNFDDNSASAGFLPKQEIPDKNGKRLRIYDNTDKMKAKVAEVEKIWLSPAEAKKYLGCSNLLLTKLRNQSKISFSVVSATYFIYDKRSIDRYLEKNLIKAI